MKTFFQLLTPLLFIAALAGCTRDASRQHAASDEEAHAETGVTFSAKRGLHVPAETAAFIGLKVADVEERPVKSEFRFAAQIYRAAADARVASARPMATITAFASGDVSPDDARVLQRGQSITVQLDRGPSLPGRIAEIEPHTDNAAVEHLDVTVTIEDREGRLASGTFVTVKAPVGSDKAIVSVPRSALLQTAEGKFVYTVSGEHFVRTAVKAGVMNDEHAEITDGLYAGDRVVVAPVMTLWMAELQSIRGGKACADGH
jgi:hypothetical protein